MNTNKNMNPLQKNILSVLLILALTVSICGCAVKPGDIQEEVTQALTDGHEIAPENTTAKPEETDETAEEEVQEEYVIEPESGLEYVEIEKPDESLMTDAHLDEVPMETTVADNEGNTETVIENPEPDTLQIVFFGDSMFDAVRDDTGIAAIVGSTLNADIYNLSIGGTTAGLTRVKSTQLETWNEPNFMGVLYAMEGKVDRNLLNGFKAGEVMSTLDPSKTDYFVIEYGTNDFLSYIPMGAEDMQGQYYFYFSSSLDMGIKELKENYPNAKIILCTPYYEEYWSADRTRYIGDIHSVNNGYGTLLDYIGVIQNVAADNGLICLNMYDLMGIDNYTVGKMTVDGVHPNDEARRMYANFISTAIWQLETGILH